MKLEMFSLYDSLNCFFDPAISANNANDFIRNIQLSLENKETRNYKYRNDLSIYHVGSFETDTGEIIPLSEPQRIAYMKELVKPEVEMDKRKFIEELKALLGSK
jgi:hypothetical protein